MGDEQSLPWLCAGALVYRDEEQQVNILLYAPYTARLTSMGWVVWEEDVSMARLLLEQDESWTLALPRSGSVTW